MTVTNSEKPFAKKVCGQWANNDRNAGIWVGVFLLLIGGITLAKSFLVPLPAWLFNWQTLLIAVGIFIGLRNKFQGATWLILIITGLSFLLNDFYFTGNLRDHMWPLIIIAIGAFYILRTRKAGRKN